MSGLLTRWFRVVLAMVLGVTPAAMSLAHGQAHHRGAHQANAHEQGDAGEHEHDSVSLGDEGDPSVSEGGGDHKHSVIGVAYVTRVQIDWVAAPAERAGNGTVESGRQASPVLRVDVRPRAGPGGPAPALPRAPPLV